MDNFMFEKPKQCINCNKTENEIQCHPFPRDMDMAIKWAKSLGSNTNIPISLLQSKYVVCQDHFCDDDYDMKYKFLEGDGTVNKTGFQLNSTAVPKPYVDEGREYVTQAIGKNETIHNQESPVRAPPDLNHKSKLTMMMQNFIYGKLRNVEDDKVNNNEDRGNTPHEIISKFNRSLEVLEIESSNEITMSDSSSTEDLLDMSIPISDTEEQPLIRQFSPQLIVKSDSRKMLVEILKSPNRMTSYDSQDDKWEDANDGREDEYHYTNNYDSVQSILADAIVSFNIDESNSELYKRLREYEARVEELEATVQGYRKSHVVLRQKVAIMRRELKSLAADQSERS